jgi:TRAP-type mannitol/chloroaromatic compound transport system substrate-binding protein
MPLAPSRLKSALTAAAACAVAAGMMPETAAAQDTVTLRLQSAYPRTLPMLGPAMHDLSDRVAKLTNDTLQIRVFEPNALVPMLQSWDAINAGSLDAAFAGLGFWVGKEPSVSFFNAVPFGPDMAEYLAWQYEGGGIELMDEILAQHNIKALNCNMISPEGSGWFRNEITSLDDLNGLKMRIVGLGGATLEKLGVSTQILAPGDIFPALERGVIDAAEFALPVVDQRLGFNRVASYNLYPGWHQPFTAFHLIVNLDTWNGLSAPDQAMLRLACQAGVLNNLADSEGLQGEVIQGFPDIGVTAQTLPEEVLRELQAVTETVLAEQAAADADFARVYESQQAFSENYRHWKQLGYLPRDF